MVLEFMDNAKNDKYYVERLLRDSEFVIKHTLGKSLQEIAEDEILSDSIMFRLIQIGENIGKLSKEFKTEHNEIEWSDIHGMRNRIVHDYGAVDFTIVYNSLTNDLPIFYSLLKKCV